MECVRKARCSMYSNPSIPYLLSPRVFILLSFYLAWFFHYSHESSLKQFAVQQPVDCHRPPILVICGRDPCRDFLDLVCAVAHCNRHLHFTKSIRMLEATFTAVEFIAMPALVSFQQDFVAWVNRVGEQGGWFEWRRRITLKQCEDRTPASFRNVASFLPSPSANSSLLSILRCSNSFSTPCPFVAFCNPSDLVIRAVCFQIEPQEEISALYLLQSASACPCRDLIP